MNLLIQIAELPSSSPESFLTSDTKYDSSKIKFVSREPQQAISVFEQN